jgi:hypothetical protein
MTSAEEIAGLKEALRTLERRMEKIERGHRPAALRLFGEMKEIIDGIVSLQEKEKAMSNLSMSPRIKLAKKGMFLGKELIYFEMEAVDEFKNKNISEDLEKRFISVIKLIRDNKIPAAKEELRYFGEIAALDMEYKLAEEEMNKKDQALRREQLRIEKTLEEMAGLEKETVDLEKAHRHEELLKSIEKLRGLRAAYIQSIVSKPVAELLGETEWQPLKEYCGGFQEKDEMAELRRFLSDYPVFGKCNASQICGFFEFSEKKLSYVCPEVSRFKKAVLGNRSLFETIVSLEQTSFLAVDDGNEKTLDFYAQNVKGAQDVIERIRQLKKEKNLDREEYEKSRLIGKRREELAKYSKSGLEKELKDIKSFIELLNSEVPEENAGKGQGALSGIGGFFKWLSGDS